MRPWLLRLLPLLPPLLMAPLLAVLAGASEALVGDDSLGAVVVTVRMMTLVRPLIVSTVDSVMSWVVESGSASLLVVVMSVVEGVVTTGCSEDVVGTGAGSLDVCGVELGAGGVVCSEVVGAGGVVEGSGVVDGSGAGVEGSGVGVGVGVGSTVGSSAGVVTTGGETDWSDMVN
jgi:hypothetical protein